MRYEAVFPLAVEAASVVLVPLGGERAVGQSAHLIHGAHHVRADRLQRSGVQVEEHVQPQRPRVRRLEGAAAQPTRENTCSTRQNASADRAALHERPPPPPTSR